MKFEWEYTDNKSDSLFTQIIKNRNYSDEFLTGGYSLDVDLKQMKDLGKAAERIIKAVKNKEKIIIFGHDDLDGITSTYILFHLLEKIGSQNHYYYIPNRLIENHGLQDSFIEKVKTGDFDLVITVDGGISSRQAVDKINRLDCEVIITDHHLIPKELPDAYAIVNPKQEQCNFPDKMIAGVGVTFFLVKQIAENLDMKMDKNYLFWTAVGTVADKVPLLKLNRSIVKKTLQEWADFDDRTVKLLNNQFWNSKSNYKKMALINSIINILSNGRRANGKNDALKLLITPYSEKSKIYKKLREAYKKNSERIDKLNNLLESLEINERDYYIYFDRKKRIKFEMLGYAASYLTKKFKIPIIVMQQRDSKVSAEARGQDGFNFVKAFEYCQDFLEQFGGHKKAAGFTTSLNLIQDFQDNFSHYVKLHKNQIRKNKKIVIDAVCDAKLYDVQKFLQQDLTILEPYGSGNPLPKILLKNVDKNTLQKLDVDYLHDFDNSIDVIIKKNYERYQLIDYKANR